MFNVRRLRDHMFQIFRDTSLELVEKVKQLSATGEPVDMFNMYKTMQKDPPLRA